MWPGCGGRFYWAPTPPSPSAAAAEARGVVVVFAWMWSDEAQLRPFVELYASLGWRCLVCHADLVSLYLSEKAASLASGVISELLKELKLKPLPTVLASFSGGSKGCMYKVIQLLDGKCEGDATMKDYRLVRNCICGQIYDSGPVDFVSDMGTQFLQNPVTGNSSQPSMLLSWMAKALASGMDTLFPSRIEAQRAEYWHTLYSSAGLGPVLIFCSEDDDLAPCHVVCGFARRLVELGTDVKVIKWSDSPHVGHYRSHEAEYRSAVNDILKKALITFCHRSQLNGTSATGDQEYKIAHSVCSLHKAAANSNESLRRVANSPSDHFFLPSSKDHNESRKPARISLAKKKTGVISPKRFVHRVKKQNESFRSYMHQDAHEFLNFLLNEIVDTLEKECSTAKDSPETTSPEEVSNGAVNHLANGVQKEPLVTWVHKNFQGILTNETKCLMCETITAKDETFFDLSVDIDQNSSLTSCLKNFFSTETLNAEDKFFCDKCCSLQEAQKRMKIKKAPRILVIHLKRFKFVEQLSRHKKLSYRVVYPMELKLSSISDDVDCEYSLFAVVVHLGSGPNQGHYVSQIKSHEHWLSFDDENVEKIQESTLQMFYGSSREYSGNTDHGYILFYECLGGKS